MLDILQKIRNKSDKEKKIILFVNVVLVMIFVVIVWIGFLKMFPKYQIKNDGAFAVFQSVAGNIRNIFGGTTEIFDEVKNYFSGFDTQ